MTEYFTDGSASPNPGPGGFAVIKNGQAYLIGGEPSGAETTNIRMEGLAIMTALTDASGAECEIKTDSEFWIKVLTEWAVVWETNDWHKKGGIKNLDIVQPLYKLYKVSRAKLTWTRGHVGTELNELADQWANKARKLHVTQPKLVSKML
ncbi:MAG: ribonuclease HI [Candidatus Nomurabacteria bacterium]|nr:ribonuclease HI [Candidatus Nomurabacteria bacterium]